MDTPLASAPESSSYHQRFRLQLVMLQVQLSPFRSRSGNVLSQCLFLSAGSGRIHEHARENWGPCLFMRFRVRSVWVNLEKRLGQYRFEGHLQTWDDGGEVSTRHQIEIYVAAFFAKDMSDG